MKNYVFTGLALSKVLCRCSDQKSSGPGDINRVGSDRDEQGCISSAGYARCAHTNSCERPWELAEKYDFENTPERFAGYCGE